MAQNFDSTFTNATSNPVKIIVKYGEQCFDPNNNNYLFGGKGEEREYIIWAGQKQPVKFETMAERLSDKNCSQAISIKIVVNDQTVLVKNLSKGGNYTIALVNGNYVINEITHDINDNTYVLESDTETTDEDNDDY